MGAVFGAPSLAGIANATDCCKVCWMDVKPKNIRLVPSSTRQAFDTPTCQHDRNPRWKNVSCDDIDGLRAGTNGRSAKPYRVNVRNVGGDADDDTVLKVCSCDLELRRDDRRPLLEAETGSGCGLLAVDSVTPCNCGTANRH